jgi:hypothetical protein
LIIPGGDEMPDRTNNSKDEKRISAFKATKDRLMLSLGYNKEVIS